jgi:hypothetical protein
MGHERPEVDHRELFQFFAVGIARLISRRQRFGSVDEIDKPAPGKHDRLIGAIERACQNMPILRRTFYRLRRSAFRFTSAGADCADP